MNKDKTSSLFTCITCRVGFRDPDIQRDHYKSDWHRYNLKRKVIELEPVTAENFVERVALQEAKQTDDSDNTSTYCSICRKSYGKKTYTTHLSSKKHLQLALDSASQTTDTEVKGIAKNLDEKCLIDADIKVRGKKFPSSEPLAQDERTFSKETPLASEAVGDDDEDEWEEVEGTPLPTNSCLFCDIASEGFESNLQHMSQEHSFFIPDVEYCTDVEGLLEYLGAKVGEGILCLWCNEKGKQFYDVHSVQQHMRDKGHCKILHEGETIFEYTDFYDYSSSYPDGAEVNPDEAYQLELLHFNENMQLVLPSGVTLGHRALKVYYKQYIRPGAQVTVHRATKGNNVLNNYRAIGYGSTALVDAQRKYKAQKTFQHARDKYYTKLGTQGNYITRHHFRRQVQF